MNNRVFVGGATANDANDPNVTKDWLATLQTSWGLPKGYSVYAQAASLTNGNGYAGYGILGGAQTQNLAASGAAIGTLGFAIANQQSTTASAWGFYGEAHRTGSGSGSAYGMELDPVAHVGSQSPNPNLQGNVVGIQLGCGGGDYTITIYECSTALQIVPNNKPFYSAINVLRGAISGTNPSITLPTGNGISFTDSAGHQGGNINATFSTGTTSNLNFTDNGLQVAGADGSAVAYFNPLTGGTNYLVLGGTASGSAPYISVGGAAAAVSMAIKPKGSGAVQITNLQLAQIPFTSLPACGASSQGMVAFVTDASEPIVAWHQIVTGGSGTNKTFVSCDGSAWRAL